MGSILSNPSILPSDSDLGPSLSHSILGLLVHALSYETGHVLLRWTEELISAGDTKLVSDMTLSQASNKHGELAALSPEETFLNAHLLKTTRCSPPL